MKFILSDESINSYGFRVITSGINLAAFKKNPVMFYNHDRRLMPIGKWKNIEVEGSKLTAEAEFDENDELAQKVKGKVEAGILNATSIGMTILAFSDDPKDLIKGQTRATVTKSDLFEASIVDIPSNKNALKLSFENGIQLSGNIQDEYLNNVLPILKPTFNMHKIALSLGLQATATEDEIVAAIAKLSKPDNSENGLKALVALAEVKGFKKETIEKLAKADFEGTFQLVQEAPMKEAEVPAEEVAEAQNPNARLSSAVLDMKKAAAEGKKTSEDQKDERKDWTLRDWETKDSNGLKAMITKNPQKYVDLFNAQYGETITVNNLKTLNSDQ